jgi:hypothetical protein
MGCSSLNHLQLRVVRHVGSFSCWGRQRVETMDMLLVEQTT